ncbi:hypothetical protein OROMI_002407 [Orobanche minor]
MDCGRDNSYNEEVFGDGDLDRRDSVEGLECGDNIVVDQTHIGALNENLIFSHVTKDVGGSCVAKVRKVRKFPSLELFSQESLFDDESDKRSMSELGDVIFTTQGIKIIEDLEHSVESAVSRSPFTTEFGSADGNELVLYPRDIRKGISAFSDKCMKFPDEAEIVLFDEV